MKKNNNNGPLASNFLLLSFFRKKKKVSMRKNKLWNFFPSFWVCDLTHLFEELGSMTSHI